MSWVQKIQSLPKKNRVRALWISGVAIVILLFSFWILIGNYNPHVSKDTSFFSSLGKGIKNLGSQDFKGQIKQAQQQAQQQLNSQNNQ